jgi:hypothetical protein
LSLFDYDAFNEKIKKFQESMEKINSTISETQASSNVINVEDAEEKTVPEVKIDEVKKPETFKSQKPPFDYFKNDDNYYSSSHPIYVDEIIGFDLSKDTAWASSDTKYNWPVNTSASMSMPFKQEFGSYPTAYDPMIVEWELSPQDTFIKDLVASVTVVYANSTHDAKSFLQSKKGKTGECWALTDTSIKYNVGVQTYVWSDKIMEFIKVPYNDVLDHWNNKKYKEENPWSDNYSKVMPVTYTAESINFTHIKEPAVEPKIKSLAEQVTFIVYQKTKPKVKKEGKVWVNVNTGKWTICISDTWIPFSSTEQKKYHELNNAGYFKKAKDTEPQPKITGSGLFFRGNCGKWHEIIEPENTVSKSINGKCDWFYSTKSATEEYDCGHDFKRVMPVFTTEEKDNKIKEIKSNQNGNNNETYWINTGKGSYGSWDQIHGKQTIIIGGRPFHHNSSNHVWYICLTNSERNAFDTYGIASPEISDDSKNIFLGAIPVYLTKNGHSFSWYLDGTSSIMAKSNGSNYGGIDDVLYEVQNIADNLNYQQKTKKTKPSEFKKPTLSSNYFIDGSDSLNIYLSYLLAAYDNNFEMVTLRNKAIKLHQYLMHDLSLAVLKKSTKKYKFFIESLEKLQDAYKIAEEWHLSNTVKYGYLKPINLSNGTFRYLYETDYGIPK